MDCSRGWSQSPVSRLTCCETQSPLDPMFGHSGMARPHLKQRHFYQVTCFLPEAEGKGQTWLWAGPSSLLPSVTVGLYSQGTLMPDL